MEKEYIEAKVKLQAAGLSIDQIRDARTKYVNHRKQCRTGDRHAEMRLTFIEWFDIWWTSGYWFQRGRGRGAYCMARYNDTGDYEIGNVFIQLNEQNVRDAHVYARARPRIADLRIENARLKTKIAELENQIKLATY